MLLKSLTSKSFAFGLMLVLVIAAGGCVRNSHAILKDDQVTANDTLLGKWVSKDGKVSAELKPGENNLYKLTYTNEDGKNGNFLVRFGKIGDTQVAEVRADAFKADESGEYQSLLLPMYTLIVITKATPKELEVTAVSTDWLKRYTQDHPDELDMVNIGGQDLIVNSPTEDYQRFFQRHLAEKGVLGDPAPFVRPEEKQAPAKP